MCLKNVSEKKIAENDIIVYKFIININDKLLTPYYDDKIKIGKKYHSKLKFNYYNNITVGLHSFKNYLDTLLASKYYIGYFDNPDIKIVKCIIPKKSIYYEGVFNTFDVYTSFCIKQN